MRMKNKKTLHVDDLIYEAAKKHLAEEDWNNIDYAVEYFLAECVVHKRLPAFMNRKGTYCPVCKFYDPIHAKQFKQKKADLKAKAKSGKFFTAFLHPAREGGFWCEIPALQGCVSMGSTLNEAKYMIKDAALGWLEVKDVNIRYRVERESEHNADLLMFNSEKALKAYRAKGKAK